MPDAWIIYEVVFEPRRRVLHVLGIGRECVAGADEQVAAILDEAVPSQRRAFILMAHAGIRPHEVRGVLWRDVTFCRNGHPGILCVREGVSFGETHAPKTGQREIPLAPPLERNLAGTEKRPRDAHVALTVHGKPWGQFGIGRRTCEVVQQSSNSIERLRRASAVTHGRVVPDE